MKTTITTQNAPQILPHYLLARLRGVACIVGESAAYCLRFAKTLDEWKRAESAGLVRLRCEAEVESYFDVDADCRDLVTV